MLKDTLTPCHSSHLGCCSAFQDGDGTLLGRVGLAPGLVPCQVVLRGRMDALGAMAALTLRSSRELRGAGLMLLGSTEVRPIYRFLVQACCVEIHFRKAPGKDGTVVRAPSAPLGLVLQ